ncbi:MAG: hypothetical protein DMG96_34995 [Acidobacteria bacterium]|nr:MAG: hypothetical protein DMG96_34995 [Acidobacteriota bacterium]
MEESRRAGATNLYADSRGTKTVASRSEPFPVRHFSEAGRTGELLEVTDALMRNVNMPNESESELDEIREIELPRWAQVPVGIILGLITLLCGFASTVLLFSPNKKSPVLAIVVGFVLLLGCAWVLEKCFRLITGRKKRGGLMSPRALRVVSFFLLVLPVVGLFTGYYREMDAVAIYQAVMYFLGFLGLRALARKREANGVPKEPSEQ